MGKAFIILSLTRPGREKSKGLNMQLYTFLLLLFGMFGVIAIILSLIEMRKISIRKMTAGGTLQSKKESKTQFQDQLALLDPTLEQAIKLYDEQVAVCNNEKWPKEEADKVLKPLKDRIDLLNNIKKLDDWGIAKPGAAFADTVKGRVTDAIKQFGKEI